MGHYVSIPDRQPAKAEWDDPQVVVLSITVEDDPAPKKTGLLDAKGVPIYRVRDRIGF